MIILSSFDVTINVVVLFSLILSVGILIDGAIIVVEYANRRANEGIAVCVKFYFIGQKNACTCCSIYFYYTCCLFSLNFLARYCRRVYVFSSCNLTRNTLLIIVDGINFYSSNRKNFLEQIKV